MILLCEGVDRNVRRGKCRKLCGKAEKGKHGKNSIVKFIENVRRDGNWTK